MITTTFGPAYDEAKDGKRIKKQHEVIRDFMLGNTNWFTLSELGSLLRYPEASISAQLRHLRKERFGSYLVDKRRRTVGTWEYHIAPPKPIGLLF
jgi:hypothetical protein